MTDATTERPASSSDAMGVAPPGEVDERDEHGLRRDAEERAAARRRRGRLYAGRLAVGLAALIAWELASGRLWSEFSISKPSLIAARLVELASSGELWTHLRVTMTETLLGLAIGLVIGIALGLGIAAWKRLGQYVYPYIIALYSLPRVALAPLFIVWFGIGLTAKVVMVVTMVVFVAFYNTYEGVRNIDRDLIEMSTSVRVSWHAQLRWVVLPSITPWLLTSLRLSIGLALIGAVISELVAASEGVGYYIKLSSNLFDTTGVFAGLVVITIVAMLLEQLVVLLERRVLRYR